ncbi:MAG: tol-pal system protein YbgF [Legionellales bacterium]|nr:tol-pal system protein YbgF [Legionellales bacterium]
MKKTHRLLIMACFACILPLQVFSEAPVVDDSENFALLDEHQPTFERPVTRERAQTSENDEETALANDTVDTENHSNTKSNNSTHAVLLDKIQGLQQEVQELRGQLEVQAHDLKLLQQQQLTFYKDLDARIRPPEPLKSTQKEPVANVTLTPKEMSKNTPSLVTKPKIVTLQTQNPATRTNPADEQISYLAAYELVKNKKFDDALEAMQTFVTQHPQGGYTANAQYWIGELYLVKKSYPEAIQHFDVVLQQFPSSSKTSASLLKIGYALAASGKKQEAITHLEQVIQKYPNTNTAQLARVKLDILKNRA